MRVALLAIAALGCGRIGFDATSGDARAADTGPSIDAAPLGTHIQSLRASNADAGDQFGLALALSRDGTTLAVAAPTEASAATGINGNQSDNSATDAGAVYVFTRGATGWTQQAYIKASNAEANDQFGWAVALSSDGNTLAVGARHEDSSAVAIGGNPFDNAATNAGAVYVFFRNGTAWNQEAYVKATNTGADDEYGASLALSDDGNTLVVGAALEDSASTGVGANPNDESATDAGAAYVYARVSPGVWSVGPYLKATNTDAGDWFGYKVAIAGDGATIAVGGPEESSASATQPNDNSLTQSGAIYIYRKIGQTWTAAQMVKASTPVASSNFGYGVALAQNGGTLAGGALDEAGTGRGFYADPSTQTATSSGAAYVSTGMPFAPQAYAKAPNADPGDDFGWTLELSSDGSTFVCGAPREQSAASGLDGDASDNSLMMAGAAYVGVRSGATWMYTHYVKPPNPDNGDIFGWALGLSGDGTTLAVGAPSEDGPNDSAVDSGTVYVYY